MPGARGMPAHPLWLVRFSGTEKGSKRQGFGPFHIISHAVTGRLACLSVVPDFLIVSVTPLPV